MTSYKKTIATMVLASMLIATVAYAEEAQAEDHTTRSLHFAGVRTPAHPRMFQAGKALNKFGRWENNMGRNEFMNGMPAIGLASMASGFGNRGAGKILKRAGWGGGCGPFGGCGHGGPFGRKLQEAQAEDHTTRSLHFAGVRTPAHPRMFQAGKALNKFGRWENNMGRNEFMNGMPAIGLASMASGFGNRGAGKILKRAGWGGGCGPFGGCGHGGPFGRKLQESQESAANLDIVSPSFSGRTLQDHHHNKIGESEIFPAMQGHGKFGRK